MVAFTKLARDSLIVGWTFEGIALLVLPTSLIVSKRRGRKVQLADWVTGAGFMIGILLVSQMTWAIVLEGEGEYQVNLEKHRVGRVATSLLISEALWTVSGALIRVSACLSIKDSGGDHYQRTKPVLYFTISCSAFHGCVCVLELFLICRPFSRQWDPDVTGACGNQKASFIIIESFGLLLDLSILIMPWFVYKKPTRYIGRFIIIYQIGIFLFIVSGLRLRSLNLKTSSEFIYSQSYFVLLSAVGCMFGVTLCTTSAFVYTYNMRTWDKVDLQRVALVISTVFCCIGPIILAAWNLGRKLARRCRTYLQAW